MRCFRSSASRSAIGHESQWIGFLRVGHEVDCARRWSWAWFCRWLSPTSRSFDNFPGILRQLDGNRALSCSRHHRFAGVAKRFAAQPQVAVSDGYSVRDDEQLEVDECRGIASARDEQQPFGRLRHRFDRIQRVAAISRSAASWVEAAVAFTASAHMFCSWAKLRREHGFDLRVEELAHSWFVRIRDPISRHHHRQIAHVKHRYEPEERTPDGCLVKWSL